MTDAKEAHNNLANEEKPANEAATTSAPNLAQAPQGLPFDMEALGKSILPATACLTLAGFVTAVPHFAHAGIPIEAVSYPRFLAAGVLFTLLLAFGWAMSPEVVRAVSWRNGAAAALVSLGVTATFIQVLGQLLGSYRVSLHLGLCTVFFCFLPKDLSFMRFRDVDSLRSNLYSLMRLLGVTAWLLSAFPALVYPVVPAQFGGGLPQRIALIDRSSDSAVPEWTRHLCATGMAAPSKKYPSCRYIYRVHENDSFLWIFVRDKWGECDEHDRPELPWVAFAEQRNSCIVRIANASVPIITSAP